MTLMPPLPAFPHIPAGLSVGTLRRRGRRLETRRNSGSSTGIVVSVRDGRVHAFESRGEALNLAIHDANPRVAWFKSQPETFALPDGRQFTPDTLIVLRRPFEIIYEDVKKEYYFARDPDFDGRRDAIVAAATARQATFKVVTETSYWDEVRLNNARTVRRAARRADRAECLRAAEILARRPMPLGDVEHAIGDEHSALRGALALSVLGYAFFDFERPITCDTMFTLETGQ